MPLTDTGFVARRAAQIRAEIRADFVEAAGFTPDWENDKVYGLLTTLMALQVEEIENTTQQLYDSLDPEVARGILLENISRLTAGFGRQEATRSRIEVNLQGTATTEIPAGATVRDGSGNFWDLLETATLPAPTALFASQEFGPVSAPASAFEIITPINGWDTASYVAPAELGKERQTDAQLRVARRKAVKLGRYGSPPLLRRRLLGLRFLTNALVLQNDTQVDMTVEGVTLPPHSLKTVVFPTNLTADERQALAQTIVTCAPAGIEQLGDETESYTVDGVAYLANFAFPTEVAVDVSVTVTIDTANFTSAAIESEIEEQLTEYISGLEPGDDVRVLEIYGTIDQVEGVFSVTALTINGGAADVAVPADSIAIPGTITATA